MYPFKFLFDVLFEASYDELYLVMPVHGWVFYCCLYNFIECW